MARKVKDLRPDLGNANRGTERGTGLLEKSLREFGFGRSILVDRAGTVIAGNKTLEAAAAAGIEDVVVVQTDGRKLVAVQRVDLDLARDARARALALADNRVAELNLDWDAGLVAEQVSSLEDLGMGQFFTERELRCLLEAPEDSFDASAEATHECPRCHYRWTASAAASRRPARGE